MRAQLFSPTLQARARRLRRARGVSPPRAARRHRRPAGADPVPRPQDVPRRRHQHQGRSREHGALARSARAADGPSAGRVARDACRRRSRCAAAKASTCSRRRWSRTCRAEILYRPKMGFAVPLARWFRGPLRRACRDAVLGPRLAVTGFFDARVPARIWSTQHLSGARDYSAPLWTLLMFDAFLRNVDAGGRADASVSRRPSDDACGSCTCSTIRFRCTAATRFARARSCASSGDSAGRRST